MRVPEGMTGTEFSRFISDTIDDARKTSGSSAEKRGRPKKDPNAPKAAYNLSTKERARRATQKRLSAAKKRATKTSQAAADRKQYAKTLEKSAAKVEKALQGTDSATIDLGDLDALPDAVSELVGESEVVFQPNDGPILFASVTTLIIVGFFLGVLLTS